MSENDERDELLNRLVINKNESQFEERGLIQNPWIIASVALAIGVAFGYFFLAPSGEVTAKPTKAVAEKKVAPSASSAAATAPAKASSRDQEILNASGYVTARLMATVSAEVMGRLESVDVEEGMTVIPGQVLAKIDDSIPRVNWELAKAQHQSQLARLESTRTELAEAERVLARQRSLEKQKLTSEAQLTRAESDVARLVATIKSLEADADVSRLQVQRQQETLDDYTVRAPFGGVVTVKNAQPGEIIAPSSAGGGFTRTGVCTIVDMQSLEIEVDVNEAFIGRVFAGQAVVANLDAYPNWDIPASVIAVIPTADRSKATVQVRIKILELDARILPDMGVKVAFLKDNKA